MEDKEESVSSIFVVFNPDGSVKKTLPFWDKENDRISQIYPYMSEGCTWGFANPVKNSYE